MRALIFAFTMAVSLSGFAVNSLIEIHTGDAHRLSHLLRNEGFDIAGHHSGSKRVSVVEENLDKLKLSLKRIEGEHRIVSEIASVTPTEAYLEHSGSLDEDYFDTDATIEAMRDLARKYPQWASMIDLTQLLGLPKTTEGRSLYALQVSVNPNLIEDEPKLLYIGQHHARELMTHHIVLDAARSMLKAASRQDEKMLKWIRNSSAWFVPVVNPDGLAYVFEKDRMWRKNRKPNDDGTVGVDLNRNYDFKWGECGNHSSYGGSQVFKGPTPQSEPEVQVMDRLNDRIRAQYLLTFHSYGDEVLYPYVCGELTEEELYYGLRDELAELMDYRIRHASSSGEDFEHHYAKYGSISFLIEVGNSFQPSLSHYQEKVSPVIGKALPFVLERMQERHIHFKVTDAITGEPIRAALKAGSFAFAEGEVRETDAFGSYRWALNPGEYDFTFGAVGYESKTVSVKASGRADFVSIELERSTLFGGLFRSLSN